MILKYTIKKGSPPKVESNITFDGLDYLELLSTDIRSKTDLERFKKHIVTNRTWWSNSTKIEFQGKIATIRPAFEWAGEGIILKSKLLKFVEELERSQLGNP